VLDCVGRSSKRNGFALNYTRKRDPALAEAAAEHRRREDAAPRLCDEVPRLLSLRITFEDVREQGRVAAPSYARPVVVATAPAHFEIRCMEPKCDGQHDLTSRMLQSLRQGLARFVGQSNCNGMVGDVPCDRTLGYSCEATYRS
jgi:hypothetical protein